MISGRFAVGGGVASVAREVGEFVTLLATEAGLSKTQAYRLRLAADEITTNIIMHGYRQAPGVIDVTGGCDADRVWIRIEDDAPAFDPRSHRPAPHVGDAADRQLGGCGLLLVRHSVDEFHYELIGGRNRNVLTMSRARPDGVTEVRKRMSHGPEHGAHTG